MYVMNREYGKSPPAGAVNHCGRFKKRGDNGLLPPPHFKSTGYGIQRRQYVYQRWLLFYGK